jgi:NAD-dependent dihydropyrimidine dehydrogenase PreA subunit
MIHASYEITFMVNIVVLRKIVKIDEEKCNGCGDCIPNCAEGALKIIDGTAKIVTDAYCDGLGACLGHCPQDAIEIIEREAVEFDEEAVHEYLETLKKEELAPACNCSTTHAFSTENAPAPEPVAEAAPQGSTLGQWPIQLNLVPIKAPFWDGADLLIMADCVPVAYPTLHANMLKGKKVAIGCPKFDNGQHYVEKLTEIIKQNDIRSMTVATMEVPCCGGLQRIAELALQASGKLIPTQKLVVTVRGEVNRI